jgi:putative transposase
MPFVEQDYSSSLEPGALYVADHSQFDFWARDAEDRPVRLWLTAVEDARSRRIVGWHIGEQPSQDAILRALTRAFADCGIPRVLRTDNGKDFRSQVFEGLTRAQVRALRAELGPGWRDAVRSGRELVTCDAPAWQGILGELSIRVIWALPYAAWAKLIERFFGTMHNNFCKTFATYCGHHPGAKPDGIDDLRAGRVWIDRKRGVALIDPSAVPTIAEVRERFSTWLQVYEGTAHRGDAMDGRSPMEVWNTATSLRKAGPDELLFLMHGRGLYKVSGNGIAVNLCAS